MSLKMMCSNLWVSMFQIGVVEFKIVNTIILIGEDIRIANAFLIDPSWNENWPTLLSCLHGKLDAVAKRVVWL